ncbi:MAG TPA: NAD(P)-dependent oxidoreductase, partial [Propionibacteriaceae bacterium]|nr:NAD(P)-dependent oxidoreductase [Propionibacteriaceae bacterium]
MRVLVTGATGMLGRGVAQALADRGDRVTVLQRRPAGLGLSEVLADISDTAAVRTAVSDQDAVIHLAAKVNVIGPEAEYRRVNVQGTRAVVNSCVTAGVPRFVYVSSPSVAHAGISLIGRAADPADPVAARGP